MAQKPDRPRETRDPNLDPNVRDPHVDPQTGATTDPNAAPGTYAPGTYDDPAERPVGATPDPRLTQPTAGAASGSVPAPVRDPVADPVGDEGEGRARVYDRPARSGPSAVIIGVVVLVLIILALIFFL